jgi:hypothetical protein
MRQRNGTDLLGPQDPLSATIGIIDVEPGDDRQSILTAILTQEKLGRKHTVVVMPTENAALQRVADFKTLDNPLANLSTSLIFVTPPDSPVAKAARTRHYLVFPSLEQYTRYVRTFFNKAPAAKPIEEEETRPIIPSSEATPAPPPSLIEPVPPPVPAPSSTPAGEPPTPSSNATPDAQTSKQQSPSPQQKQPAIPPSSSQPAALPVPTLHQQEDEEPEATAPPPATRPIASFAYSGNHAPQAKPGRHRLLLLALLLLILLLGTTIAGIFSGYIPVARIFPGITSATVMLTPDSKNISMIYPITAVTTTPDTSSHQIAARNLAYTTPSQTRTVKATGRGPIPATQAKGTLTLYNALRQAQTLPAGTVFTASSGLKVSSDEAAIIPPANPPTMGVTTIAAHAVEAGARGNVPAFHFDSLPCCHPGITVTNTSAFENGKDEGAFSYVQQSDIDSTRDALAPALLRSSQSSLRAQIFPQERLIGDIKCIVNTISDRQAGARIDTLNVTASATCTGEVYDQQSALTMAEEQLQADALKQTGNNYRLTGKIKTTMLEAKKVGADDTIQLRIKAEGLWVYHFEEAQKQALLQSIANKPATEARTILSRQPGVRRFTLDLFLAVEDRLPGNPQQITLVLQRVP